MKFFQARKSAYHTSPRLIDDVLYTTYSYRTSAQGTSIPQPRSHVHFVDEQRGHSTVAKVGDLLNAPDISLPTETVATTEGADVIPQKKKRKPFDAGGGVDAEIFVFAYGTVVIWGMSEAEEKRFLSSMYALLTPPYTKHLLIKAHTRKRFEEERLAADDVEMEDLNYYYANYSR